MPTKVTKQFNLKAPSVIRRMVGAANSLFNDLSNTAKKVVLLSFGLVMGGISFMLIIQALNSQEKLNLLLIEGIGIPKDIYMRENNQTLSDDELAPIGKLKGEIDGEFEAFYLAVDRYGNTYINHSIDFSKDAYHKSKGWKEITKAELENYEKHLHFIPSRRNGMRP